MYVLVRIMENLSILLWILSFSFCHRLVLCFLSHFRSSSSNIIFFFLFLCILDAIKADIEQSLSVDKSNLQNDFYIGPYLDGNEVTNITVQIGTNAYLPCKVCVIEFFFCTIFIRFYVFFTRTHLWTFLFGFDVKYTHMYIL